MTRIELKIVNIKSWNNVATPWNYNVSQNNDNILKWQDNISK